MSAGPKASAGAARTPSGSARPLAPSPGVGVQFPTPAAPPVPSPGVGVQFPTPYQTPGGINASLFGGGPAAAGAAARHAGAGGAGAAGAAGSGSGVMPFARMHGAGSGESLGVRTGAGGGVTREQGTGTGSGSPVQGLVAGRRGASPLQLAVESIAAVDAQAGGFAFTGMDDCGGGARSAAGGASPEARETMLVELRQQLGARGGAAAAAGRAASQMQAGGRSGRQSLAQAGGKVLPCTPLAAGGCCAHEVSAHACVFLPLLTLPACHHACTSQSPLTAAQTLATNVPCHAWHIFPQAHPPSPAFAHQPTRLRLPQRRPSRASLTLQERRRAQLPPADSTSRLWWPAAPAPTACGRGPSAARARLGAWGRRSACAARRRAAASQRAAATSGRPVAGAHMDCQNPSATAMPSEC